ncbi:MAG: AAA family ATPase [Bacteroidota bacterium]
MSKNKHTNPTYINRVKFKGYYKSILDLDVKLYPGLNVIIGVNGSGKSNFIKLLKHYLTFESRTIESEFDILVEITELN